MSRPLRTAPLCGTVRAPASKSQAHRLLICAALGRKAVRLSLGELSGDLAATLSCLRALGAQIDGDADGLLVHPIGSPKGSCILPCGESGSTLRFLLPIAGALGVEAEFRMEGRLSQRPMSPLTRQLALHGMKLRQEGSRLYCQGRLQSGSYTLPGNVSSQFITGLLLALPLLEGESRLTVTGAVQSAPYIAMTEQTLHQAGLAVFKTENSYRIPGSRLPALPERCCVEGDWSSAAAFACIGALSVQGLRIEGLSPDSQQADRVLLSLLRQVGAEVTVEKNAVTVRRNRLCPLRMDASQCPDLVPVLAALLCLCPGESRISGAERLRLKESDRLRTTAAMLNALGACVRETEDGLGIRGQSDLPGGFVSGYSDHRIAMAAAVAACGCTGAAALDDDTCVQKSYPRFWEDYTSLQEEKR